MSKEVIQTEKGVPPQGAYSQGWRAGDFIFVSGTGPVDPATGKLVGDTIEMQTERVIDNLELILGTAGFMPGGRDVLFVVWDEQDGSLGHAPIPFIVVSPLIDPGTVTGTVYNHYSLLATWEDGFGLPRLGHATEASPIADIWR